MTLQPNSPAAFPNSDFARAIEVAHTYQQGVTQHRRREAEEYLMALRCTAEGYNLALNIISSEQLQVMHCFWAFNTIIHHLPDIALTIGYAAADELYSSLFSFIYRYFFANVVDSAQVTSPRPCTSTDVFPQAFAGNSPSVVTCGEARSATSGATQRHSIDFLANKHAQMMVAGLQEFFPSRWCSFFDDAFELVERSASLQQHVRDSVTLYVLRLFEYIDERVVSVRERVERRREQRARDMEVKDAMRERVIPRVTAFWYRTLYDCHLRAPGLAKTCLGIVHTYIEWVDIALFFTSEWINLLYFMLTVSNVRGAACECLCALVEKKQLPDAKLNSLRALNVVDAVPQIVSLAQASAVEGGDANFLEAVAKLVREVAVQFLALYEHIVNSSNGNRNGHHNALVGNGASATAADVGSGRDAHVEANGTQAVPHRVTSADSLGGENSNGCISLGGTSDASMQQSQHICSPPSGQFVVGHIDEVRAGLDAAVGYVLPLLSIRDDIVVDTLLPLVQAYIKSPALLPEQAEQILRTLYDHTIIHGVEKDEEQFWMDDVIDRRKQIHNVMRLLLRSHPKIVLPHMSVVVMQAAAGVGCIANPACTEAVCQGEVLREDNGQEMHLNAKTDIFGRVGNQESGGGAASAAEHVEAALRYLYEIGETIRMERLRDSEDGFARLIFAVLSSEHIPQYNCAVVHLSYFEVMDRYSLFFVYHKNCIPQLLQRLLLLPHGVLNSNEAVRGRICYLFGHLVQVLKSCLAPHVREIVTTLQHILSTATYLLPSNRRELYEAMGTLLGSTYQSSVNGTEESAVMMQRVLQAVAGGLRDVAKGDDVTCAEAVADNISYLSVLAKGLRGSCNNAGGSRRSGCDPCNDNNDNNNNSINNNIRSVVGSDFNSYGEAMTAEIFHNITADVINVSNKWHASASVRDSTAQYFTQMVHTLPFSSMNVYAPVYIGNWLTWMEAAPELVKLLRIFLQLIHRSGLCVAPVLSSLLPLLLEKAAAVGELCTTSDAEDIISEGLREQRDVYRQLLAVVHGSVQVGCANVILALPAANLNLLLRQLLTAVQLQDEAGLPKLALQIMTKITASIEPRGEPGGDGSASQRLHGSQGELNDAIWGKWANLMLNDGVRVVLHKLLSPTFDLKDAKNLFFIGEAGLLLMTLMGGPGAANQPLSAILYETFSPLVGADEATGFISALQGQTGRFSTEMRMRFCNMLKFARRRYEPQ
uniref:Exportin-T n=1 Tax=Trypanosoma congolense (strain IL3000) TaxID=1068625 RepID=G0UJ95_TRYCI|nr:putative tRNA exportin [Trypanosoma congolense IL3000]